MTEPGGVARQAPHRLIGMDHLERRLRHLEAQIRLLNSAQRIGGTNFVGGNFRWQDENQRTRFQMGTITVNGTNANEPDATVRSFTVRGDDGGILIMQNEGERGLVVPTIPVAIHPATGTAASVTIASGTFVDAYEITALYPVHEVLFMTFGILVDAGTTAQYRIRDQISGDQTSAVTVAGETSGVVQFEWLHPAKVGLYEVHPPADTNRLFIKLQARISAGGGDTTIGWPNNCQLVSAFQHPNATTTGNPQVF
jgi:hypothetical protein